MIFDPLRRQPSAHHTRRWHVMSEVHCDRRIGRHNILQRCVTGQSKLHTRRFLLSMEFERTLGECDLRWLKSLRASCTKHRLAFEIVVAHTDIQMHERVLAMWVVPTVTPINTDAWIT